MRSIIYILLAVMLMLTTACQSEQANPISNVPPKENELQPKDTLHTDTLDEIMTLSKKGMVDGSPYNISESTFQQVKNDWGEPTKVDVAGQGYYATYEQKNIVFGYNENGDIFDIRSYETKLNEINSKLIEKAYGAPSEVRTNKGERIFVYKVGTFELKFIIPDNTQVVDHISVFNPKRAKAEESEEIKEYLLDIKGVSNQLSDSSWQSMKNWREEIVEFSKGHKNVFINGRNDKMVSLTFDDGPDATVTPAIVDVLDQYGVKGNFFFVGNQVKKYSGVVMKAFESGHLILSHTYSHIELTKLKKEDIRAEIQMAEKAIKTVTGKEPAIIRTPYGDTNDMVARVASEEGDNIVLWSIDTLDWSQMESGNIVKNVLDNVRNGDIILMHSDSDKSETVKALPRIIEGLKEKGFDIVSLEKLLHAKAYK